MRLSDRLRAQYPEEMTIVLQHQFWDLKVTDEAFEVGLSFGGVAERLVVPFDAIKAFADPSVQFTLQFETLGGGAGRGRRRGRGRRHDEPDRRKPASGKRRGAGATRAGTHQRSGEPAAGGRRTDRPQASRRDKPADKGGAEVVRLDRFRKK